MGCDPKDCVSMHRVFPQSGLKECVFKKNNYEDMAEGVWVRISPASLDSQSWVEHRQGYTGGVEGKKVENWCGGGGEKQGG